MIKIIAKQYIIAIKHERLFITFKLWSPLLQLNAWKLWVHKVSKSRGKEHFFGQNNLIIKIFKWPLLLSTIDIERNKINYILTHDFQESFFHFSSQQDLSDFSWLFQTKIYISLKIHDFHDITWLFKKFVKKILFFRTFQAVWTLYYYKSDGTKLF